MAQVLQSLEKSSRKSMKIFNSTGAKAICDILSVAPFWVQSSVQQSTRRSAMIWRRSGATMRNGQAELLLMVLLADQTGQAWRPGGFSKRVVRPSQTESSALRPGGPELQLAEDSQSGLCLGLGRAAAET